MNFITKAFDNAKKERGIAKKMKKATTGKAVSGEALKLKKEFDLSDEDAKFMAKRKVSKQKRQAKIGDIASGISDIVSALDMDGPAPKPPSKQKVAQAKRDHTKKKNEGKKGKGSGKKFDPLSFDIPDLKF